MNLPVTLLDLFFAVSKAVPSPHLELERGHSQTTQLVTTLRLDASNHI
jgi:hypothetical protein